WAIIAAFATLIVVVVVNLIGSPDRFLPPAEFNVFFAVLLTLLFAAFVAQAVQEAWGGNIRVKIVTAFTVVALTSLALLGTVTYINYRSQVREDIRQRLYNMVSLIALQQDAELHAAIQNAGDEETDAYMEFKSVNAALIATEPDLVYIYTMRQNDQGEVYFVVDTGQAGDEDTAAVAEIYDDASPEMLKAFATSEIIVEKDFYTDQWGTFLSAYAPFYNADGQREGVVGIDIAADTVLAQERSVFLLILGTTLGTMVIVTILGLFLGNVFTKPIINLSNAANRITEGDLSARAEVETTDEVGDLAQALNQMTSRLQRTLQGLEERVAARTRNLELAAEVGRSVSQVRALDVMLKDAAEIILKEFDLYYVQVYLTDVAQRNLVLEAGTGDVGAQLLSRAHSLPLNTGSINGRAAVEQKSVVISDTAQSVNFRKNPLLPETRGEMAVPLIVGGQVVGVLDMQSRQPGVLNEEVLPAFEALAGQLAVAIQNANLVAEAEASRAEVEKQARRLVRESWDEHLDAIHKPEQLGYVFAQNSVTPLASADETQISDNKKAVSAPLAVTGEELGSLTVELEDEARAEQTTELVNIVARQVAQQIENLRLLESAERYRIEAEKAARLQTVEGWQEYMRSRNTDQIGYLYDTNEIRLYNNGQEEINALTLPVKARDEKVGKLLVHGLTSENKEEAELANVIAERLGAHIESLRLLEETKRGQVELDRRAQQLASVAEISTASSQELDVNKLLNTVVQLTQRQFGLYHTHIFTFDATAQELNVAACGWLEGDEHEGTHETISIPLDKKQSLVARAARTKRAVIVNDVKSEPGWLANPLLPDTASEMAVPLVVGDRVLGVLDVQSDRINAFSDEDANIQTTLASQIATAMQNASSFTQAQKQAERESTLNVINQKIQSATSVEAVLQIAARELGHALGAPMTIAQLSMKDKS
ncbi:MAG TPA: GAF domain-containing protein, partial [Anaerolineales bacterium]|nr:GAF domain-containing protein [Anaerolineales bacterium]